MQQRIVDPSFDDVEDTLKQFRNPNKLEFSSARFWPAVHEQLKLGVVMAIRSTLKQALERLEVQGEAGRDVLRLRYIDGRSIESLAKETYKDQTTVYRLRKTAIEELQVILGQMNREAQRHARIQRFTVQGPVVGVHQLSESLADHLRDPLAEPVLVLEGMGGLGKTTLARLIARRLAHDDTFAGILWTSAQQTSFDVHTGRRYSHHQSSIHASDLVGQLAAELGLSHIGDAEELRTNVTALCKLSPYLIVFDNLESIKDMAVLAPLIEALVIPSRIIITTRDRAPDALPPDIKRRYVALDELDAASSIELLRAAARSSGMSTLRDATDADLGKVYDVTGGNPLALWLVAGQSDSIPWGTFLRELTAHRSENTSVEEVYTYLYCRAWRLLGTNAKRVLLAMHLFERGTDYDTLQHIVEMESSLFQQAVEELRHRMLVMFGGSDAVFVHRLTYTFICTGLLGWQ